MKSERLSNVTHNILRYADIVGGWHSAILPTERAISTAEHAPISVDACLIPDQAERAIALVPDLNTLHRDPFDERSATVICNIAGTSEGESPLDARAVAQRAERYLERTGLADSASFGVEVEFYVFDSVKIVANQESAAFEVECSEAPWSSNATRNSGRMIPHDEGAFRTPPSDSSAAIRTDICAALANCGVRAIAHHHELGAPGQVEIALERKTPTSAADALMLLKHIAKATALQHDKTATFMPKPFVGAPGSGLHVHQSLWKHGSSQFYEANAEAQSSKLMSHYIGGLLEHFDSLLAFCAPTTNSYKRIVPNYEPFANVAFAQRDRSLAIRIPALHPHREEAKRLEFRSSDGSCNPYLAFAALLCAGIDGIMREIEPVITPRQSCGTLSQALDALERDYEYITDSGVMPESFLNEYISFKRRHDVKTVQMWPHPIEYRLYYDV